jgi:PAS domain S-box-containing protein
MMPMPSEPAAVEQSEDRAEVGERLRNILSASGAAAAWEWHVAERRIVGDPGFATLYGITPTEAMDGIAPNRFFAIIHPQDRDRMRLAMGGMLRGSHVLSKQFRILAADGTVRWLQARGRTDDRQSRRDGAEQPVRFSGVLLDITEQKRLEEQLRIAQTAGGVGTFEHVGGFGTAAVSAQFCALLGMHVTTDLPVRTVNAVVWPGDPALIDLEGPAELAVATHAELRITRADTQEVRWLMRRGEHIRDAETAGIRFSGVIYDITEAKRVEAQLRVLNETLEMRVEERTRERDRIWRVSQDLLGVADANGVWVSINPAWGTLLGWNDDEIIGRTSEWLEHEDDFAATQREVARLAAGHKTLKFENRFRRRDGGFSWLSWTAVPEDGMIYCVGRHISAEKEAASALAKTQEQLRQSHKMEAVGQLTGGIAHDFNNLLTGISGSLEMLQSRVAQRRLQDADRYIAAAQSAAKRAAALTHRLLAFSRRQTLEPKSTDVNRLVSSLDELARRTMGPAVQVEVVAATDLWTTLVDPNQLENALLNLCINARDAMPAGGRLTIETANRWLDEPAARERDLPPGGYVTLCVSDNGTGMSPDVAARAFDPFFTTKPIGQGTGLGLSMIYGFARQSGGQVRIYSELGRGTTICIYLPRHLGHAAAAEDDVLFTQAPRLGNGETILVVDDEPAIRMLVAEMLDDLGYAAIEASDGPSALRVLQSEAQIDLLVTDVGLTGGWNGRQVAEAARVLRPDLKVLFMTGYAENAVLGNGHLDPGMHVLTKPFSLEVLASLVRLLVSGRPA